MRIVHVAAEFAPLAKVGGLADAVAGLARAQDAHHDVTVVLPAYPEARAAGIALEPQPLEPVEVVAGRRATRFRLLRARMDAPRRVLLLASPWFDTPGIYADDPAGPGAGLRFGAFCRAVLAVLARIDLRPDVLHVHDHPAAFVPTLLRRGPGPAPFGPAPAPGSAVTPDSPPGSPGPQAWMRTRLSAGPRPGAFYDATATVLTVHNAAHQGSHDPALLDALGIDRAGAAPGGPLEFWGRYSALKAGLLDADAVTTVSPAYAEEVQGPLGFGLEGVFRETRPVGIVNGIDVAAWDPARDPHLAARFSADDPAPRARNREALADEFGLDPGNPVVGMVTRLDEQKGVDLLAAAADRLLERAVSLVVLGRGDPAREAALAGLARGHPGRVAYRAAFDEPLAHRIYGGADLFLLPSRFEPFGLTQLLAMRYGAIPVARRTGGIADTVRDADAAPDGDGFLFDDYTPEALLGALDRALAALGDPGRRRAIQARILRRDLSWDAPAARYDAVYREAALRRKRRPA